MALLRRLLFLVLFIGSLWLGLNFAAANDGLVEVNLVFATTPEVQLWLALVASFAAGAVVAATLLSTRIARGSLAQRRYRKAVSRLESEVHQLRSLPVTQEEPPPVASPADVSAAAPDPAPAVEAASAERGA